MQICKQCDTNKPLSEYHEDHRETTTRTHRTKCKRCQLDNQNARMRIKRPSNKRKEYQSGARRRNLEFSLDLQYFKANWQKPCSYCGADIETIGLDRLKNSVGYTEKNCVPCCFFCNRAKSNLDYEDFVLWIKKVSTNL